VGRESKMKQVRISHYTTTDGKIQYVIDADDAGFLAMDIIDALDRAGYNINDDSAFDIVHDVIDSSFMTEYRNYN
jgi:hypothetical protein